MEGLRLYYSPGACSLAAHIVLEETGAPYERSLVSTRTGATASADYRAINPKARVPALAIPPDLVLTEVAAILFWLAERFPDAGLLPADRLLAARVLEWMNFLTGAVHAQSYGQIWRPARFADDPALYPAISEKGRRNVAEQYAYIESVLADGRAYAVAGADYSIADPYLLVFYLWGGRIGLDMAQRFPAWAGIAGRVAARPAVQRVFAIEEIALP